MGVVAADSAKLAVWLVTVFDAGVDLVGERKRANICSICLTSVSHLGRKL